MNSYKRLLRFVGPYKGRLIIGLACTFLGALFNMLSIALVRPVFDKILNNCPQPQHAATPTFLKYIPAFLAPTATRIADTVGHWNGADYLFWIPIGIAVAMLLKGFFNFYGDVLNAEVCNGLSMDVRKSLFEKLHALPLSFHSHQRGGQLISRFSNDVSILPVGIQDVFSRILRAGFNILFFGFLIFFTNLKLAVMVLLIFPVAIGPLLHFGRRLRRHSTEGQARMADLLSVLHESLAGMRIVKAFNLEPVEYDKLWKSLYAHFKAVMRQATISAASGPVMEFIGGGLGLGLLFYLAGRMVLDGSLSTGQFVTFIAAIASLYPQVKEVSGVNNSIQNALAAADRVFEVLDTPVTIQDPAGAVALKPLKKAIEFSKVSFHYVPSKPVLSDFSLKVKAGQVVAIVGPSGAGKTTLVDLLPRFYDPISGSIAVDGVDLRKASLQSLRGQIGIVTQETFLFNDTIAANIAYGRPGASQADIEAAAKAANAHEFVLAQAQGYQTLIGERGARLSGGQRQRLAIARAILKNPPILILDEATSALDTQSERLVQAAMDRLMKKRTTLVIAHRLSTVQHADAILVLDKGRLVESGKHAQLLKKGGLYAKLYRMQFHKK